MISQKEYLENPCGTLSIPYWKSKIIEIPDNMKIVHHKDYNKECFCEFIDEPYFRLLHSLRNIKSLCIDDYYVKTATKEDIPLLVEIINRSYSDLSVTYDQLLNYTKSRVYDEKLWILVYEKGTSLAVGCGIAEVDKEIKEGILGRCEA